MEAVAKVSERDRSIRRDPEHGLCARWPDELVRQQVDIPQTDVRVVDRQPEPLLARAEPGLGPDPLDMCPAAVDHLLDEFDLPVNKAMTATKIESPTR